MVCQTLDNWYQTDLGQMVALREEQCLQEILPEISGQLLLEPFASTEPHRTRFSTIPGHVGLLLDECSPQPVWQRWQPMVRGSFDAVPFRADCFDLVLLPHVLEFVNNPDLVLAECHRVLRPNGKLLLYSFNPLSLWGIKKQWAKRQPDTIWQPRWHTSGQVKKFMAQIGLEVVYHTHICYFLPAETQRWLQFSQIFEKCGLVPWFPGGGVYLMIAIKQGVPMTLTPTFINKKHELKSLVDTPARTISSSKL